MHEPEISHTREVLSNISGSVSLACWVILLLPQLLEQWRLKSSEGVAIGFIIAWLLGDLANFIGSLWGHLRPNVVLLALWFCFSDTLLIMSYFYYKRLAAQHEPSRPPSPRIGSGDAEAGAGGAGNANAASDCTPLLQEPSDHSSDESFASADNYNSRQNWLLGKGLPAVFVIVVATLSYFISDSTGPEETPVRRSVGPEILGYISAVFYLTARIPQIVQNQRRHSVQGLSMGFFTLSIIGNLTYAGQMIIYRTDAAWMMEYIPWLLGSLGTIVEDLIILGQFYMYKKTK